MPCFCYPKTKNIHTNKSSFFLVGLKIDQKNIYTTFVEVKTSEGTEITEVASNNLIIVDGNKIDKKNLGQVLKNLHCGFDFNKIKYAKLLVCVEEPQVFKIVEDF